MSTNTVTGAVAKRNEEPQKAKALVAQYRNDFAEVLPSHIKPATWIRLAQGALKKGKLAKDDPYGRTELEVAACNNPGAFLAALLEAARLGLEPGTDLYYLTPRRNKKNQGRLEILGIVGYQGHIELMYNAGAIASVVAEVVHEKDIFRFRPGADDIPHHEIDWDADDRGPLRLVYAFARMKDGATSKVVVLNRTAIAKIRAVSPAAAYEDSIWDKWEASMWLKSAVRQLQKWVPTSAELRNRAHGAPEGVAHGLPEVSAKGMALATGELAPVTDITDTWIDEGDGVVEGEIVEQTVGITERQSKRLHAILTEGGINRETKLALLTHITRQDNPGRAEITSSSELTEAEATNVIDKLAELAKFKIPLIESVIELIDRPAGEAS
jgi:recombination protein RecT